MCLIVNSTAMRGRYSKLVTASRRRGPQPPEQFHGGARIAHGQERRLRRARTRKQLQARGRDHAERAFGADEQVVEVVAGVVLAQARESVEHLPVGQHDLETEHEFARHAVAQRIQAAGVGREVAADLAAALGAERQRKETVGPLGRGLHVGENAAGLGDHREIGGIHFADAVQAPQRKHDLVAASPGVAPPQ